MRGLELGVEGVRVEAEGGGEVWWCDWKGVGCRGQRGVEVGGPGSAVQ